jgi:hypothetical protein
MLTDKSIDFVFEGEAGTPLVWVIDEQCLYDLPLSKEHAAIFVEATEVVDISDEYPEHDGITVRFLKDGEILEEFQTSEYFGSVLLSEPLVLDLQNYAYGMYVESPNAMFVNNEFVILDRDMTDEEPFYNAGT